MLQDVRELVEVDELYVDSDALQMEGLRVKLRPEMADDLGVPRRTFHAGTIDVSIKHIQAFGETVVLRVDIRTLWQQPASPEAPPAPGP